ncbi:MAG: hypothetical protein ACM3UU_12115 [Ignavibacteriales bacterium]
MSFVYAKKIQNTIVVFGDTKITFDPIGSKALWSEDTHKKVQKYGLIKNMIISNNFCVSFAGKNIIYANELLKHIRDISLENLLKIALDIHLRNHNSIDFIICYADCDKQDIYEIKNGLCNNVEFSWIGSYDAFRFFQGVRSGDISKIVGFTDFLDVEISFGNSNETEFDQEYLSLFDSFHKTLFDCKDDSVGGVVVPVVYNKEKDRFCYKGYGKCYSRLEMRDGKACLPFYQDARKGTYTVIFYNSFSFVGIYIPESNLGIIYNHARINEDDYTNTGTSRFWLPQVVQMNELDFYIQVESHGLYAPRFCDCDPDNIPEIFKRVSFYKDKPLIALLYINKLIEIIETTHREEYRLEGLRKMKQDIEIELKVNK